MDGALLGAGTHSDTGKSFVVAEIGHSQAASEAHLERLGELVAENVDRKTLLRLTEAEPAARLPVVSSRLVGVLPGDGVRHRLARLGH